MDVAACCETATLIRFFQAICPASGVYKQGLKSFGTLNKFSCSQNLDEIFTLTPFIWEIFEG